MIRTTKHYSFSNLLHLLCLYIGVNIGAPQADIHLQSEKLASYLQSHSFYSREFCRMTTENSDECTIKIREEITSQKIPDMLVIISIGSSASILYKNGKKEIDRTINLEVDDDAKWLAGYLYASNLTLVAHLQDDSITPDGFLEIKPYYEVGNRASLAVILASEYIAPLLSNIQKIPDNLQNNAQIIMDTIFKLLYPSDETRQQERLMDELN